LLTSNRLVERSDDDLWSAAARGDADAFATLFTRHGRAIYNFCFRLTADWALAQDLTSVTFLEAWRRREAKVEAGAVRAWLFGIANYVVRNQRRTQRRHRAMLDRLGLGGVEPDFADEVDLRIDDEVRMRSVLTALRKLPARDVEVIALCLWADLSYSEASAALGVPVGTVRSRLARARQRAGELLRDCGHSPDTEMHRETQETE
jgi:RNA polymerase sigma-70 factor (ECF subfamily)